MTFFRVWVLHIFIFTFILVIYLTAKAFYAIDRLPYIPTAPKRAISAPLNRIYLAVLTYFRHQENTINRVNLIEISLRNMQIRKSRSFVTVGGMAVGIGAIVFLVSIGYGLQELVVGRVARLEEMRQTDVSTQPGSQVEITDETVSSISSFKEVAHVLPLISVVGRVNFQNSISDMAAYGVTAEYLKQSAIQPVQGAIFDSNNLSMQLTPSFTDRAEGNTSGNVAGAQTEANSASYGDHIQIVELSIDPTKFIPVRESPSPSAPLIGYTRRAEGIQTGEEVWGGGYIDNAHNGRGAFDENNEYLGRWVNASVLLWEKTECSSEKTPHCIDNMYLLKRDIRGFQAQADGYLAEINMTVTPLSESIPEVLAAEDEKTDDESTIFDIVAELSASGSADLELIKLASEAGIVQEAETQSVELAAGAVKQAVVNRAMLAVLGISEDEAIGKTFDVTFIVTSNLLSEDKKVESKQASYTIVGVIPEDRSPFFYVPFIDLRGLGIKAYSQMKVVANDRQDLQKIREQIEGLGLSTTSVSDTVAQIDQLFGTARQVLALVGMVALAVASLGMFNTLTVSLLERTREVGLMKAMGMKSHEVQELFLTESMLMGFFGGVGGILLGYLGGKLLGLMLSVVAISQGEGFINISTIPPVFVGIVFLLSLIVGIATGIYPASRATKISALNALRYE